jgi:MFS family permease
MQDSATDRVLPTDQRRNLIYTMLDGVAIGLMSAAVSFISVFVVRLGASPLWVSLLSSIPSTIALVMTVPWAQLAERLTRPQRAWAFARLATHTVYPLIAIVPSLFGGPAAAQVIVIIWSLSALPSSLSNMMFTLVMGNAVPPESRAFLMSRRWTVLGVAKLIALPLVSALIERLGMPLGYQIAFGINALIALGAFFCANQLVVPERELPAPAPRQPLWTSLQEQARQVLEARPFLVFVSGRAMLNLGLTLVAAVIPLYWVNDLQASDTWVGYFSAALSAATLLSYLPWTRIKRKYGARWVLLPSVLGTALYPALLALARTPAAVLPVIAFNGLAASGLSLAFFDALFEVSPPGKQARFVAINMTAIHLMGVIGPPVGAALVERIPIRYVLVVGSAVSLVGFVIFAYSTLRAGIRAGRQALSESELRSKLESLRSRTRQGLAPQDKGEAHREETEHPLADN